MVTFKFVFPSGGLVGFIGYIIPAFTTPGCNWRCQHSFCFSGCTSSVQLIAWTSQQRFLQQKVHARFLVRWSQEKFQVSENHHRILKGEGTGWPLVGNEESFIPIITMYGFIPSFPTKGHPGYRILKGPGWWFPKSSQSFPKGSPTFPNGILRLPQEHPLSLEHPGTLKNPTK